MTAEATAERPPATITLRARLTMKPYSCTVGAGLDSARGVVFSMKDIEAKLLGDLRLQWLGPAATAFVDAHTAELVPGRCLDLEIHHVRPAANREQHAEVSACQLAPLAPSWAKHQAKAQTQNPENPTS